MIFSSTYWIYPISCIVSQCWILPCKDPVPFEVHSNGAETEYLSQLMILIIAHHQRLFLPHLKEVHLLRVVVNVDGVDHSHRKVYASWTHARNCSWRIQPWTDVCSNLVGWSVHNTAKFLRGCDLHARSDHPFEDDQQWTFLGESQEWRTHATRR